MKRVKMMLFLIIGLLFVSQLTGAAFASESYEAVAEMPTVYRVIFKGADGTTLRELNVVKGESVAAHAPKAPEVEGYTFMEWESDGASTLKKIVADTTFTAIYKVLEAPTEPEEPEVPEEPEMPEVPEVPEKPEVPGEPEAEPMPGLSVQVKRVMADIIRDGDSFYLEATLVGFEDADYSLQWQYDDGHGWMDVQNEIVQDANELTLNVIADPNNVNYNWRILVSFT